MASSTVHRVSRKLGELLLFSIRRISFISISWYSFRDKESYVITTYNKQILTNQSYYVEMFKIFFPLDFFFLLLFYVVDERVYTTRLTTDPTLKTQ